MGVGYDFVIFTSLICRNRRQGGHVRGEGRNARVGDADKSSDCVAIASLYLAHAYKNGIPFDIDLKYHLFYIG